MELKTMKFDDGLVPLVISGAKTCTWRLWDDKNLKKGDEVWFVKGADRIKFAKAKLISVIEKKFDELNEEDCEGHEDYSDKYEAYSKYYGKKVLPNDPVKVIKFELLEVLS
jgi:hypothetical protein